MKRLLVLLVLAGLGTTLACGDDDGTAEEKDAGNGAYRDASSAANDAATKQDSAVAKPVQIENVGNKCKSATDCTGASATCEVTFGEGDQAVALKDGYCTAVCAASSECGAGGGCPLVDVTTGLPMIPGFNLSELLPIPSYCLDKCDAKSASDCRDGYECKSIGGLVPAQFRAIAGAFLTGPAFSQTYCMPPIEIALPAPADAGTPDASAAIKLDGGLDAGR